MFPQAIHSLRVESEGDGEREREREREGMAMNVEEEVGRLKEEMHRLGQLQPDGSYKVIFCRFIWIPDPLSWDLR